MRFLHTSDWHLGRQLHNRSLIEDQRHALDQLLAAARQHDVQAIIVAGDIFDRAVPTAEAVALLDETVHRVRAELGVALIMIAGNHDSGVRLGFGARQLAASDVYISGPPTVDVQPLQLEDEHGPVGVYPIPYLEPMLARELLGEPVRTHEATIGAVLERIRAARPAGERSIVVSHCFVAGGEASESERPLSVGGAEQVPSSLFDGFDYVALGHLHAPQHRGRESVRYSGSLLKYAFSEAHHDKGFTLVEMDAQGGCQLQHLPLEPLHDARVVRGTLHDLLAAAEADPGRDDYLLVQLDDTHAILDVMGQLRSAYPNVLHVERPGLIREAGEEPRSRQLRRGELAMFEDFWGAVGPAPLDEAGRGYIATLIDGLHQSGDG